MARFDDEEEDRLRRRGWEGDPDSIGEALRRAREREREHPEDYDEEPMGTLGDAMERSREREHDNDLSGYDASPLNDVEDVSTTPFDAGPEPDFAGYEASHPSPPDDPEAMASYDAGEGEIGTDYGTLGAAMDHNPAETEHGISMDPNQLLMPLDNPAVAATLSPYMVPAGVRDRLPEPDADDAGGPPDMDADDGVYNLNDASVAGESPNWTDDFSDDEANTTGSEMLPVDIAPEAREALGITGPVPGTNAHHPEPDADDMGGPPDGDADDAAMEGAGGLASPWDNPYGARIPGTLDMSHRPRVHNPDGSISTVRSASFGFPEGEVLLPTVSEDGRIMSNDEAIEAYRNGGGHLGIYDLPEDATRAGLAIHDDEAETLTPEDFASTGRGDVAERVAALGGPNAVAREVLASGATKSTPYDMPAPEGPDYTAADWSDAVRRPLHGIAAGLLAASGRGGGSPFRSERAAMEEREGARTAAKGAATEEARGREAEARRYDADRASREGIAANREDRLRDYDDIRAVLGMRRADTADRRADTYGAEAGSRTAARDAATARTRDSGAAASETSRLARERLAGEIELLPESIREAARAAFTERDDWSADDVLRIERDIPAFARAYLSRGAGGRGPGGAGRRQALMAEAARLGIPESTAAVLDSDALEAEIRELSGSGATEGDILIPGVPLSEVHTPMTPAAMERRRDVLYGYADGLAALDAIEAVHNEYGASARISPEAAARLEAPLGALRSMVARINGIGVIQPGERALVDATLPDATSLTGMTFGGLAGSFRGWRDIVESSALARLRGVGASPEAVAAGMDFIHTAGTSGYDSGPTESTEAPTAPTAGTVEMEDEDGNIYDVAPEDVEGALDYGWTRVE